MMSDNIPLNKRIREFRESQMIDTQKKMEEELLIFSGYLHEIKLFESDNLSDYCLEYLKIKLQNKSTRSYFISQIYDYLICYSDEKETSRKDFQLLIKNKIGFILEVVIVIQYLDNQILDGKFDLRNTPKKINKNLITSNILKSIIFEYIDFEIGRKNRTIGALVEKYVRQIFLYVDLGQRLDKEYTNYKFYLEKRNIPFADSAIFKLSNLECIKEIIIKLKNELKEENQKFADIYFRRIFLTNVCLFYLGAKLVTEIISCNDKKKEEVLNFSTCYGIAMQIVNDIIDFIPADLNMDTVGKKSTDAFSDLRNMNITLPLIFHLEKGYDGNIEQYLNNPKKVFIINKMQNILIREIISSRGISKAQRIGYLISKKAKSFLDNQNPRYLILASLTDIATMNKFYFILKKIKKSIK